MSVYVYCLTSEVDSVETAHEFIRTIGLEVTTDNVENVFHALKLNSTRECLAYNGHMKFFGTCSFNFLELNPEYVYAFDPNVSIKELMFNYYLEH